VKIAVATMDGQTLSQHFGQSAGFVVFDVQEATIKTRELRSAQDSIHAMMHCDPSDVSVKSGGIKSLIGDCEVVLVGGIGAGAIRKLEENGVHPVMMPNTDTIEDAIGRYLKGDYTTDTSASCDCHH